MPRAQTENQNTEDSEEKILITKIEKMKKEVAKAKRKLAKSEKANEYLEDLLSANRKKEREAKWSRLLEKTFVRNMDFSHEVDKESCETAVDSSIKDYLNALDAERSELIKLQNAQKTTYDGKRALVEARRRAREQLPAQRNVPHCSRCETEFDESAERTPRLLKCGHSLCQQCVTAILKRGGVICPADKERTKVKAAGLLKNFAVFEI
ncbi:unnamed protein product [Caenorhabditis sp. 36 PRJEB53466]|nr:unnamed protein product [Caenorhabditis sp. 36 PRJEB53466]